MGKLTDAKTKALKSKQKAYTVTDGNNLQLSIKPNGGKLWEFRYYSPVTGKRRKTSFGTYPNTTLKIARDKAIEYNQMIAEGIDPINQKKQDKQTQQLQKKKQENTFKKVCDEWLEVYSQGVSESYFAKVQGRFENHVYPRIGHISLADIEHDLIIELLITLSKQGKRETADRIHTLLNSFYKYAVAHRKVKHNIIADIDKRSLLGKKITKNYPTITDPKELKALLIAIDDYQGGEYSTQMALRLLPYVMLRSKNIRLLEWSEIDFDKAKITIPADKMKNRKEFTLPLTMQAVELLQQVREANGGGRYVFKSFKGDSPMSENTLLGAIRRLGYSKDEFVPHSFRSVFSTIANEYIGQEGGHSFSEYVIDKCLAHQPADKVEAAYNRAGYLEQMRELLQWWGNKVDEIKGVK